MAVADTPGRRIGATDSKTREQLLDAAEALLLDEGYAAVTSRKVAAKAGLKPQLVHYYFRTMDELFIEMFRRQADANIGRFERLLAENPSLDAIWALNRDPRGAAFVIEFAALGNHRKEIKAEIARYAERNREIQLEIVTQALKRAGVKKKQMPPVVALLLLTGLGQVLGIERTLGVATGHAEAISFVEGLLPRD